MFTEQTAFYLQKDERFKKQGLSYSVNNSDKIIGTIRETRNSSKKPSNYAVKLINILFLNIPERIIMERLEMELLDQENNILGMITKEAGFYKDLLLHTKNGEYIAAVQSSVNIKSPSITVFDENGNKSIKASGRYPATDFSVFDCKTHQQISSIKKRSLIYSSIKENLLKNDVYHFNTNHPDKAVTFALIGMGIALDLYFHKGE